MRGAKPGRQVYLTGWRGLNRHHATRSYPIWFGSRAWPTGSRFRATWFGRRSGGGRDSGRCRYALHRGGSNSGTRTWVASRRIVSSTRRPLPRTHLNTIAPRWCYRGSSLRYARKTPSMYRPGGYSTGGGTQVCWCPAPGRHRRGTRSGAPHSCARDFRTGSFLRLLRHYRWRTAWPALFSYDRFFADRARFHRSRSSTYPSMF